MSSICLRVLEFYYILSHPATALYNGPHFIEYTLPPPLLPLIPLYPLTRNRLHNGKSVT